MNSISLFKIKRQGNKISDLVDKIVSHMLVSMVQDRQLPLSLVNKAINNVEVKRPNLNNREISIVTSNALSLPPRIKPEGDVMTIPKK